MPRWLYQEVRSVTVDNPSMMNTCLQGLEGYFWDSEFEEKLQGVEFRKTQCFLTRNKILQLHVPNNWDSPKFKHRMHDFFACKLGVQEIIPLSRNM